MCVVRQSVEKPLNSKCIKHIIHFDKLNGYKAVLRTHTHTLAYSCATQSQIQYNHNSVRFSCFCLAFDSFVFVWSPKSVALDACLCWKGRRIVAAFLFCFHCNHFFPRKHSTVKVLCVAQLISKCEKLLLFHDIGQLTESRQRRYPKQRLISLEKQKLFRT